MPDQTAQVANGQQNATNTSAQPQVGDNTSVSSGLNAAATDSTSQVDDGAQDTQTSTLTLEQALRELAKVRREAAENRTARRTLEAEKAEAERAKLSKEERLAAELADAEKTRHALTLTYQERMLAYETKLAAADLGIIDPDAAMKLLDTARLEYADDGSPKNLAKLLKELVAAKPYLVAQTPQQIAAASAARASATNSASVNQTGTTQFSQQQIANMTPDEYKKYRASIFQAQRAGRILPN